MTPYWQLVELSCKSRMHSRASDIDVSNICNCTWCNSRRQAAWCSSHENRRCLLIEGRSDGRWSCFSKVASNGRHTEPLLARWMLVVSDELNEPSRTWLQGLSSWGNNFEVDGGGGTRCDRIEFPSRGLTDTNFRFTDTSALLPSRDGMSDKTWNFQLFGCLHSAVSIQYPRTLEQRELPARQM